MDSVVDYQPLPFESITEDLRFLLTKLRRPRVAWLDPNFGVRFDDYMAAIERAARPGQIRFIAYSSLSLLSDQHLELRPRNGLDSLHAMNVRPKNYTWPDFYDHVVAVNRDALSGRRIRARFLANRGIGARFINAVRAGTSKRVVYQSKIRSLLDSDSTVRAFFEGDSRVLPAFYKRRLQK